MEDKQSFLSPKNMHASFFIVLILLLLPGGASAKPEFSEKTGQGCMICHIHPESGEINETGLEYAASGYTWPPEGGYRLHGALTKSVRVLIGFLHITASFIWFGAILYVHMLLRPGYASKGLPKGEVMLGLGSMMVVGVTGVMLTVSKIRGIDVLFKTRWGIVLLVKISLYLFMISTALLAVFFIGPRLKRGRAKGILPVDGVFDPETLSGFDGQEGRPALIAYSGRVYDATPMRLWKDGLHMKHRAGEDLTSALKKAPHGEEKLSSLKDVGRFDAERKPELNAVQKAFYAIAYINLGVVFLVLFVLALWRWNI